MAQSTLRGKRSVPLTTSNVLAVVREVKRWWGGLGSMSLTSWLYIPESKQKEIMANFSDEMDQKKQAISYWINTDPLASWRRLIVALDRMGETELADSIRSNAEPLTDDSLTPHSVARAVAIVRQFWGIELETGLLECLGVPVSVMSQIRDSRSYSSEEEKRVAGLQYCLQTVPGVSWGRIAGVLWYLEEHTALETVRQYLPHTHDISLTLYNLTSALDSLHDTLWWDFGWEMDVPVSILNKIESQLSGDKERKAELLRVISTEHPHLTWEHVSDALYRLGYGEYHHVLERVQSLFPTGRRRAKKIYQEEMKRGVTKRKLTKLVMVGIAGSGKSTSLQTVIGEEPLAEDQRTSTSLLTRPVQTEVVVVHDKVHWKKRNPEEKKKYIASLLRERAQRLGQASLTSQDPASLPTPAPSSPAQPLSSTQQSSSAQQSSTATQPVKTTGSPTTNTSTAIPDRSSRATPAEGTLEYLLQSSEEDQEYISLINIPSDSHETLLDETVVYVVDSGGQPEFMEAMAVFLGETSACVLVMDLSQSLDEHPQTGYWLRGKAVSKPYRCIRTNEENLKKFIQTINTFTSKTKGPPSMLLFLGTHRDLAHKCLPETVADKNERLKKLIPAKFEKQIIQLDKKTLIFEINALNPDDTDRKTAEKVRSYILEQCPAKEVEIPVRWDAFEEKLRSLAKGLGRQVMSRKECWRVAQSLGLEENSFNEALDFFHNWSLMFYFRDILPEVVFIDPQVILDKVSELVVFMFELREPEEEDKTSPDEAAGAAAEGQTPGPDTDKPEPTSTNTDGTTPEKAAATSSQTADESLLPPGWQQFEKFGHVTKAFLEDKRFSSHYHRGIFSCEDLIHLLEELLVFAKLESEEGPETWLMPSVLRQVAEEKVKEVCVSAGPLVVDFPDGGPQNGIFCSLMAHVLSPQHPHPHPWKLCLSSNLPKCLYRDCIQFHVPDFGSVTLVDRFQYFEAHVSDTTSEEEEQKLWQHVGKSIFNGIETVSDMLGYSNNKPRPAIICPKSHSDKAHTAYIKDGKWNCTSDMGVRGTLAELGTVLPWCDEACKQQQSAVAMAATTPPPTSPDSTQQLDTDDLFEVVCELDDVAHMWRPLGTALRLRPSTLARIKADHQQDSRSCLSEMVTEWLNQSYNTERFGLPSWKMLVEAVAHRNGGNNNALAIHIATKYKVPAPAQN
ncbi:hypothetical protein GBAR_LOCUS25733 [Geodia barretti]|uniref:Death domain-containing protein n=1 Tax=Geodia barretti TaxID=519541 RepID=A0AA35TEZ4_GEOBA|nr:hypothetical protein GBAR_LOCUS25733 [Geodia barretti]